MANVAPTVAVGTWRRYTISATTSLDAGQGMMLRRVFTQSTTSGTYSVADDTGTVIPTRTPAAGANTQFNTPVKGTVTITIANTLTLNVMLSES